MKNGDVDGEVVKWGRSVVLLLPFGRLGAAEDYALITSRWVGDRGWRVSVVHPQSVPIDKSRANPRWEPIAVPDDAMSASLRGGTPPACEDARDSNSRTLRDL